MRSTVVASVVAALAFASAALLPACSSDPAAGSSPTPASDAGADASGTDASAAGPLDVRFDTFNVGLAGTFVANEVARRPAVIDALAAYDTDVMCLSEVWFQADKDAIARAVKAKLPYAASTTTDLATPVTDRKDADGNVQPAPTTPPCTGQYAADLNAGIECLKANCSTQPGSLDGRVTSTTCAKDSCSGSAASLLFAQDKRCYGCFAAVLPSATLNEMKTECTTEANGGLFAKGQNGLMILSRYPLSNIEQIVLPGTWIRRTVLKATASLPNGAKVDTYCNHLTPYFADTTFYPYTGQFGAGNANGWIGEQVLQAKQLVAFVNAKSGSGKAVVMGDMNATREDKPNGIGDATLGAYGLETLAVLEGALTNAVPAGYTPKCTFCVANQNTSGEENSWLDYVMLKGFPAGSTTAARRTFDTDVVDGKRRDASGNHTVSGKVPLSDHYGIMATVRVAP
jgi:endonuclease/exonuclease/phosphatase family metal-dependent hydrolase